MAVHADKFEKQKVKLIVLSRDNVSSHSNGVNVLLQTYFPFPIILGPRADLAVKLGVFDEARKENPNARALYVIDPLKKLRLAMIYPTSTGLNVHELLRVIDSLQLVNKYEFIATPANWRFGGNVMVITKKSDEEINNVLPESKIEVKKIVSGGSYMQTVTIKKP